MFNKIKNFFNRSKKAIDNKCNEMVVNEIERGQIAEKKKPAEKKKCEKGIDI